MQDNFIRLSISISKLNKALQHLKTSGMQLFGLKAVHTLCMYQMLDHEEGMSFSDVQEACDLDQALVSRILAKLTAIGMVLKVGEPGKYNARYVLTEHGTAVARQIRQIVGQVRIRADEGIDPGELEIFYKVLGQLQHNFDHLEEDFMDRLQQTETE